MVRVGVHRNDDDVTRVKSTRRDAARREWMENAFLLRAKGSTPDKKYIRQ